MLDFLWGSLAEEPCNKLIDLLMSTEELQPDYMKNADLINTSYLTWFQAFAVEHVMISKGDLFSLGTGLGKTVTACGVAERLLRENPNCKIIFACIPTSIDQIRTDFETYLDRTVCCVTGEEESIRDLEFLIQRSEIVIASYKAFYSTIFCNTILDYLYGNNRIVGLIADEVHEISQESIINSVIKALAKKIEYKFFLTATPITVSPGQLIEIMNMIDSSIFPEGQDYLKPFRVLDPDTYEVKDYRGLEMLGDKLYPHYVAWTRDELGLSGNYIPELVLIKPTEEQLTCNLKDIPTIIKGQEDSPQMKALLAICQYLIKTHKRGLIYSNRRANSRIILENLQKLGINARVANGEPEYKKEKDASIKAFNAKQVDILITNMTTSLNLDSDFVVYWENTNRATQMLGRCERGFLPKDLYIYYILTEDTVELTQFEENVYKRSKWMKETLGTNNDVFEKFHEALKQYNKRLDILQQTI